MIRLVLAGCALWVLLILVGLTVPDLWLHANGMTPGTVRHRWRGAVSWSAYRVNADSSVTFIDRTTDTWLTLPPDYVELFPRAEWWWQRLTPPKIKGVPEP